MAPPSEVTGPDFFWTLMAPQRLLSVAWFCITFLLWHWGLRCPSQLLPWRPVILYPISSSRRLCVPDLAVCAVKGCRLWKWVPELWVPESRRGKQMAWHDSDLSFLEGLCCLPEQGTWQGRGPNTVSQVSFPCIFTNPRHAPSTLSSFQKHWQACGLNLTNTSLPEAACLSGQKARQAGQTAFPLPHPSCLCMHTIQARLRCGLILLYLKNLKKKKDQV